MERLQLDPTGIVRDASWWANQAHVGADAADLAGDEEMATEMEVPGAGRITLLVPPGPSDTVVRELLESDDYPPFAPNQLLLALLRPGMVFADLGAHVGTYSLPAAALGARVVAVDAHPQHARLLERAAERNGFSDRLTVVHAAIGAEPGEVEFLCSFGWSMVIPTQGAPPEFAHARRVRVPVLRVPDALAEAGLTHADLIKMDLEGSEAEAVAGMSELLSGDDAPAVLFEINPLRLGPMGSSTSDLLSLFERFGYRLFKLEQSMEEPRLVPITPEIFLPDSSDDVLAVKGEPELDRWRVTHPLSRHDQVDRALGVVRSPFRASRRVVAERLRTAPPWLLRDPLMR
jgi:FkbM family methyltransferase